MHDGETWMQDLKLRLRQKPEERFADFFVQILASWKPHSTRSLSISLMSPLCISVNYSATSKVKELELGGIFDLLFNDSK
jgi:hypothetical protein|tara:strand:- start:84 stop:323 length:240 start_codon:yes stop_codon:yes gene_type:complete